MASCQNEYDVSTLQSKPNSELLKHHDNIDPNERHKVAAIVTIKSSDNDVDYTNGSNM